YYGPAARQYSRLAVDGGEPAQKLALWKHKVLAAWPKVSMSRHDSALEEIQAGDALPVRLKADLGGLEADDVKVECVVGTTREDGQFHGHECFSLVPEKREKSGEIWFSLDLRPALPGPQYYKIRMFPFHKLLSHPFELGCMLWL
ncbi:MAG: glycosyltransferase family 1 protein, partial [Gammaproteobacteria bacterium]|nr:glycosyltransferase family 1 protein [Gammaproteobacteria bacterium]